MSDENFKRPIKNIKDIYRYICPRCLRTFLSDEYEIDWFCWKCGELLEVFPKDKAVEMKVIYEFNPLDDEFNDRYELAMVQNASKMHVALNDIDNICKNLRKGYVYFPPEEEKETDDKFEKINLDKLLDDLGDCLFDSGYIEII